MIPSLAASTSGSALWYLSRGTGSVTLILLTLSLLLGVVDVRRWSSRRIPRFVIDGLHQTVSLLVVATLALHVVTSVLDPFAPVRVIDALVPFVSSYRPIWLGLGALALDLLVALIVTSLLRGRLGHRGWRWVHWLAYACWPVALVHAMGTGSDIRGGWMLVVSLGCVAAVMLAILWRLAHGWPEQLRIRMAAAAALAALGVGLAVWLPIGPLAPAWARRAGTPKADLAPGRAVATAPRRPVGTGAGAAIAPGAAFTTPMSGRINQVVSPAGDAVVRFGLTLQRGPLKLAIELHGRELPSGGVSLDRGSMTLGPPADAARYRGRVTSLQGGNLTGLLEGAGAPALQVSVALQVNRATGLVSGTAQVAPTNSNGAPGG